MKKIIRLTESDLARIVRRVISEEEISYNVLNKYLISKPELIPLYQEIEKVLGDKFTEKHFVDEIKYSGGLKNLSGGLLPSTINSFKLLKTKFPNITYSDNSYRTYENQKDVFLKNANRNDNEPNVDSTDSVGDEEIESVSVNSMNSAMKQNE